MEREEAVLELEEEDYETLCVATEDELLDLLPALLAEAPDDADPLEDIVAATMDGNQRRHAVDPGSPEILSMQPDHPGAHSGEMVIGYRVTRVEAFRSVNGDGEPREVTVSYRFEAAPPQLVLFADREEKSEASSED